MNNSDYEERIWRLYLIVGPEICVCICQMSRVELSQVFLCICVCRECESKRPHLASGPVVTIWGAEGSGGGGEERLRESPDTWGGHPLYQYITLESNDFIWIVSPGIERCQRRYKRLPSLDLSLPHPHLPQCHNRPTFHNEVNVPGHKIPEKQNKIILQFFLKRPAHLTAAWTSWTPWPHDRLK